MCLYLPGGEDLLIARRRSCSAWRSSLAVGAVVDEGADRDAGDELRDACRRGRHGSG